MPDQLLAQLKHRSLTELASVLRTNSEEMTEIWQEAIREAIPSIDKLTITEARNDTASIIRAMSEALVSDDPAEIKALVERSPFKAGAGFAKDLRLRN